VITGIPKLDRPYPVGVLSLILWALILVMIRYLSLFCALTIRGESGIITLVALLLCSQFTGSGQSVDGVQLPLDLLATQAGRRQPLVQIRFSFLQVRAIRVTTQGPGRFPLVFRSQAPAREHFLKV